MITGELKNKIDSLWDIFASGGLVNPLEVIEQIKLTVCGIFSLQAVWSIPLKSSSRLPI